MQELAFGGRTTKYQNQESPEKDGTQLTLERGEDYLASPAAKG